MLREENSDICFGLAMNESVYSVTCGHSEHKMQKGIRIRCCFTYFQEDIASSAGETVKFFHYIFCLYWIDLTMWWRFRVGAWHSCKKVEELNS